MWMVEAFKDDLSIMGTCRFGFTNGNRVEIMYPDPNGCMKVVCLSNLICMTSYREVSKNFELPMFIIYLNSNSQTRTDNLEIRENESAFDKLCLALMQLGKYGLYAATTQEIEMIDDFLKMKARRKEKTLNGDDKIYNLIAQADRCRKEIVLCLLGQPGIGKTEAVERYAKDHGRNVVHIIASQILPNEVSGITMPDRETHSMEIFDHYRLSHMKDGDILFFDELLQGQQQVLSACLTLIQERRLMSGAKLPDILIVAAANPLASPIQLRPEIRQRFMFVNVVWNAPRWIEYMQAKGFKGENTIKSLSNVVARSMNNTGEWNTLTPRTATKLCEWMLKTECDKAVKNYIEDTFGRDIADCISAVANVTLGYERKKKNIEAFKSSIMDVIDDVAGDNGKDDAKRTIEDAIDRSVEKETFDMSELMDILMDMPEWPEISKALESIEMPGQDIKF